MQNHRFNLTLLSIAVVSVLTCSTSAYSQPTVSGGTISWPNDGWYQVQNADDYTSICEGMTSCDVQPGAYIVINHSTGERYENVEVSESGGSTVSEVTVTGNIISWPNDGWYQVQRADDYSSVCEGVNSCMVDAGVYNVINHTTGQRFDGIEVDSGTTETSGVTVNGNTISWPDNGWYQVQSSSDYTTLCEGVASCEVSDGTYNVINQTTGERFDNIMVAASGTGTTDGGGTTGGETGGTTTGGTSNTLTTDGILCDYVDSTFNDSASVNATSNSAWTCSDESRQLTANGLPDHAVGEFPNPANPNTITEQDISTGYTLTPTLADRLTTMGGPAGAAGHILNGIKIDAGTGGSCDDSGENCSLGDNSGGWSIEALSQDNFDFGTDENNAHVQPSGEYHYHGMPEGFITKQGGNSSTITLIGWAADGFPIYARYGYSDADDANSEIVAMTSSYQLVESVSDSRPSTDILPLGTFQQDWEYVEGTGDLDACNGRTGVTPEFPSGIYHYYATDTYPFLQRCVMGEVAGTGGGSEGGTLPPPGGGQP